VSSSCAGPAGGENALQLVLQQVRADLRQNVLPFWTRNTWDQRFGGFITHLDRTGNRTSVTDKYLVMQSRMIWTLAAAHRHGITDRGYLDLAARGVEFLHRKMLDRRHGGFFWSVRANGRVLDACKSVYGHAFVIYALSEYTIASGDADTRDLAGKVFDLLHDRAADAEMGFREHFNRRWRQVRRPWANRKTLDTHLHVMEAFTNLAHATMAAPHRAALAKVRDLLLAKVIDPQHGCGRDPFDRWWCPLPGWNNRMTTSYGHDVELAWLLLEAADALGENREKYRSVFFGLVDHVLAYGFDADRGGIAWYGPIVGPTTLATDLGAERLVKSWWEQAEMLVALLEAYQWTRHTHYREAFLRQFDWIWNRQIDHEGGAWHAIVSWEGKPVLGDKGDARKCPYHNSRSLMRVERALAAMLAGPAS
jgi:mannobiose 2-epimerase